MSQVAQPLLNRRSIHQYFEAKFGPSAQNADISNDTIAHGLETTPHTFYLPCVILPVIHVDTLEQTVRNVEIVQNLRLRGCFLINQRATATPGGYEGYPYREMLPIAREVRKRFPGLFLGVNFLAVTGDEAFPVLGGLDFVVDGYWADTALIEEDSEEQVAADKIHAVRNAVSDRWNGLYFGGVCFKKQKQVAPESWQIAAQRAAEFSVLSRRKFEDEDAITNRRRTFPYFHGAYMDVVMTSGAATGVSADLEKIEKMRKGVGRAKPLGLASGVTPENIGVYLGEGVDVVLVATGVSSSFHELSEEKLGNLLAAALEWDRTQNGPPVLATNEVLRGEPVLGRTSVSTAGSVFLSQTDPAVDALLSRMIVGTVQGNEPTESANARCYAELETAIPNCLKHRKRYLRLHSENSRDDFGLDKGSFQYAWLDPSSTGLAINAVVEDMLVAFCFGEDARPNAAGIRPRSRPGRSRYKTS